MKSITIFMASLLCFSFFLACDADFQKNITKTEQTIKDAERINAKNYASTEFRAAKQALEKAKMAVKNGNKKEAANQAMIADKNAKKAYFLTIDRFSEAEKQKTKKTLEDGQSSGADRLAPDEYGKAEKLSNEIDKDTQKLKELQNKLKKSKENKDK